MITIDMLDPAIVARLLPLPGNVGDVLTLNPSLVPVWQPNAGGSIVQYWQAGSVAGAIQPYPSGTAVELSDSKALSLGPFSANAPHLVGTGDSLKLYAGQGAGATLELYGASGLPWLLMNASQITAQLRLSATLGVLLGGWSGGLVAGALDYNSATKHFRGYDGTAWQQLDNVPALNGLPTGGATGFALIKNSAADFDTKWADPTTLGPWLDTGAQLQPQKGTYPVITGPLTIASGTLGTPSTVKTSMPMGSVTSGMQLYRRDVMPAIGTTAFTEQVNAAEAWTSGTHQGTNWYLAITPLATGAPQYALLATADGMVAIPGTGFTQPGLSIGTAVAPVPEMLRVAGAVVIAASRAVSPLDGTLQYTGTGFQGRVGGAWVDIPGAAATGLWAEDDANNALVPAPPIANYGIAFQCPSDTITFRHSTFPAIQRRTGISADDNLLWINVAAQGMWFKPQDSASCLANFTAGGLWRFGDNAVATERLELATGGIMVASALAAKDGTLQYQGGHFLGRVAGAWVQLDGWQSVSSPWAEDATSIHPVTIGKAVYLGTTTTPAGTVNDLRFYAYSANQVTNGVTEIRVASTNPGVNQLAAFHMVCGTTEDWLLAANQQAGNHNVGFYNWYGGGSPAQIFVLNHQGSGSQLDNIQCLFAEFVGQTGIGAGYPSWLVHGKGDAQSNTGGASSTTAFNLRAMNWPWPSGGIAVTRHYHFTLHGSIARAAGQVTLNVLWGLASAPVTIFTWPSGAVSWANANFFLDVDILFYLGQSYYTVKMWLTTDPATQATAGVTVCYMSRGGVASLQSSSSAQLNVQGQYDTSNAGNVMTAYAQFFEAGQLR